MHTRPWRILLAVAGTVVLAGCGGPVLTVRHVLPAALPMPADVGAVRAKAFAAEPAGAAEAAVVLARLLNERLEKVWPDKAGAAGAEVGGTVRVDAKDARGARRLRQWDAKARAWAEREVPTLVRTVAVDVTFGVERGGRRLLAVESRRTYRSTEDPRVRGETALERPDDPERVPPADQVVRELLAECAESFCKMITPDEVVVQVPTRGTLSSRGAAGLKAAGQGDFPEAVRQLEAAVAADPNNADLRFDLAVACEAAGQLEAAVAHYQEVVERTGGKDRPAAEAAKRAGRILKRLRAP